ncbi:25857_t:CDS:2, partial [Dentiscutata erythropus]
EIYEICEVDEICEVIHQKKEQAKETRDKPIKIVQDNIINTPEEFRPYIPLLNTLHRTINHVHQVDLLPQLQHITELNVPESLRSTLNGNLFLIKDQTKENELELTPTRIIMNFEFTAINMSRYIFPEAEKLVCWFEETYMLGKARSDIESDHIIRIAPLFPPQLWLVYDSVDIGIPRTQNVVEAWYHCWATLV